MPLSKPICFPHIIPKGESSRFTYKCTTKWCLIRSQVDQVKFNIFLKALQQKPKAGLLYRKCAEMWNLSAFPYNTALCKREFVFSNIKRLLSVSLKCFATPWSKLKRNLSSSGNICVRRIIDIFVFLRKSLLCLETIVSNFPEIETLQSHWTNSPNKHNTRVELLGIHFEISRLKQPVKISFLQ